MYNLVRIDTERKLKLKEGQTPSKTARSVKAPRNTGEWTDALRSRMEEDPPKNVDQIPILSGNVPDSSGPQKPSFGPGSSRTMNAFFQKTAGLL